ncbi:helix-turn-helix domain-containing protein [Streptomyces sp. NPDC048629]|uniref:IclR family transcriptional regulator n=1 Tax=Streptomyces sp. NPDC048629 TaxID=3154824 RepID=UPI00341E5DD6
MSYATPSAAEFPHRPGAADTDGTRSTAAEKVLTVLLAFAPDGRPRGVSDLARRTGLSKSTTHRMLCVLVAFGLVQREDERYGPGAGIAELAGLAPRQEPSPESLYRERLLPIVSRLAAGTRSRAAFSVLVGPAPRLVLSSGAAEVPGAAPVAVGHRPWHTTASGKVLLAFADQAFRESVLAEIRTADRPGVVSVSALRTELERVRERRVATDTRDLAVRMASVAVPVIGAGHKLIGAVSVDSRQPWSTVVDMVPQMRRAAADASAAVAGERQPGGV